MSTMSTDVAEQLAELAFDAAQRADVDAPESLAWWARQWSRSGAWALLFEARDLLRIRATEEPGDLAKILAVGLLDVALRAQKVVDLETTSGPSATVLATDLAIDLEE